MTAPQWVAVRGRVREAPILAALAARPSHLALAGFVSGLLAGPRAPRLAQCVALTVVLAAGLLDVRARRAAKHRVPQTDLPLRSPDGRSRKVVVGVALCAVLGTSLASARVRALDTSHLQALLGREDSHRVTVQEAARASPFGGWSALVELRGERVLLRSRGRGGGATDAGAPDLPDAGTILSVTGRLQRPSPFARARRAHGELVAGQAEAVGHRAGMLGALDRVRRAGERGLDRGLPPAAAGLLRGMVLGQDAALPAQTRDEFRAAGLSHLVAASGTNVVLLAALVTAACSALGVGMTVRLWLVLGLIVAYVPLAGGGASIQRAGVMGAAAVVAGLAGRPASRWWALGLAAAATLVMDPRAAQDPGWQLSFAAVLAILLVAGPWRDALERRGVPRLLAEVGAMTAAATLATAPIVAAHFGQASLVGLPVNLLAAPAVAPVMWLGVCAAAVGQLLALGGMAAAVAATVADGLDAVAGFPLGYLVLLARVGASVPGGLVSVGPFAVLAVCVLLAAISASSRLRRLSPLAGLACAAVAVAHDPARAAIPGAPRGLRVTLLDVGQGDATLLQAGARTVLVDTGPADAGVVASLRHAGVRRLDLLVVTHAQADHLGGAAAVVSALPVGLVLDGRDGVASAAGDAMAAVARARRVSLLAPRAGQVLRLGGLKLRVLWPGGPPAARIVGADPNDRAIVLEADADGARVLLTADAESDVLSRLDLRPVDVLKVSHHGSADVGLPAVLARLRPRVAAIEVGKHNTYGHPAPSTLDALGGVRAVVRTDRDGTVRLDHNRAGAWEIRAHV